jgi:hypothetical protein
MNKPKISGGEKCPCCKDGWSGIDGWFGLFATRRQCMACMGTGRSPIIVDFAGCEPGEIAGVPSNFRPDYDHVFYSNPTPARQTMIKMLDAPEWRESLDFAPNVSLVELMRRKTPGWGK